MSKYLGWLVALYLICNPARASAPTLCLWDMYAMSALAGISARPYPIPISSVVNEAVSIANEMIKRRREN